jgi:hypothetical protein
VNILNGAQVQQSVIATDQKVHNSGLRVTRSSGRYIVIMITSKMSESVTDTEETQNNYKYPVD